MHSTEVIIRYADAFEIGQIDNLGSHKVTKEEIINFAQLYDPQPYHLSEEAGQQSHFGGLVASGWHTASIWMKLYVEGALENTVAAGSPGIDELRWIKPVQPNDKLYGEAEVISITPSLSERDVVTIKKKGILRRSSEDVVCSLYIHSRIKKRPQ